MVALGLTFRNQTLENTEGAIKTGNPKKLAAHTGHIIRRKTKTQHRMCRTPFYANKHKQEITPTPFTIWR